MPKNHRPQYFITVPIKAGSESRGKVSRELRKLTAKELNALPTIKQRQWDNIKLEFKQDRLRVSLSRMTKADGADWDNGILVEKYNGKKGIWEVYQEYPGGPL